MFRNYLLADRILRSFGCTPISYPPLPGSGCAPFLAKNSCMADHPLWQAWDLACETMLFQLMKDGVIGNSTIPMNVSSSSNNTMDGTDADRDSNGGLANATSNNNNPGNSVITQHGNGAGNPQAGTPLIANGQRQQPQQTLSNSVSSPFFSEQLTAFEIWLELAPVYKMNSFIKPSSSLSNYGAGDDVVFDSPEQLPVVLQVLLSQVHRIRALMLICH